MSSEQGRKQRSVVEAATEANEVVTKFVDSKFWFLLPLALLCNLALCRLVVERVAYTEIDWIAYMQEVGGVIEGKEFDYANLRGGTGPLVYPAGFVWLFAGLYRMSDGGKNVRRIQMLFALLHTATVAIAAVVLRWGARPVPPLAYAALFLSRRVVSLYVLRLFNDAPQTLLMLITIALAQCDYWSAACVAYTLSLSIKMNALLYAPAMALLLFQARGPLGALWRLSALIFTPQVVLALPFLIHAPRSYVARAFELSRVFLHKWSVNGAMLAERDFTSGKLAVFLLAAHLVALLALGQLRWTERMSLGLVGLLGVRWRNGRLAIELDPPARRLCARHIAMTLFSCNFVGVVFARTLHYQFYLWYVFSLPFLVCGTHLPVAIKLMLPVVIEAVFNIYPPKAYSAIVLNVSHYVLLGALCALPRPHSVTENECSPSSKKQA